MRYKATLILSALLVVVLALSYFVFPEVTTSDTEMRSMRTCGMIFENIDSVD